MKKCNIHVNSIPRREKIPMKKIPERMNGQKLTRVEDKRHKLLRSSANPPKIKKNIPQHSHNQNDKNQN